MHVYTEEQKSIATIGSLKVRVPSIPLEKVYNRTRLEQHMYGQEHIGTYVELTKNPTTAIEEGLADYQAFIKRANVIVDEIKELDATNSLDISINGAGSVVINYKESLLKSGYIPDKAISDKEAISEWISGNSDKRHGLGDLARKYTLAKSIKDYESATGINRDELYEKYKESIKEGSSHYKAQEELNEYPFKISRYATMSFGTNPISYQAVDQMGTPGYVRNGRNHPKAKLPSMNGSY